MERVFKKLILRHLIAFAIGLAVCWFIWTVVYFQIHVGPDARLKADEGRYLISLIFCFVQALVVLPLIFAPSSLLSFFLIWRFKLSRLVSFLIALFACYVLSAIIYWIFVDQITTHNPFVLPITWWALSLAGPFVIFWLITCPSVRHPTPLP